MLNLFLNQTGSDPEQGHADTFALDIQIFRGLKLPKSLAYLQGAGEGNEFAVLPKIPVSLFEKNQIGLSQINCSRNGVEVVLFEQGL